MVQLLPHCGTLLPLVSPPADPTLTTSNILSVLSGVEERWEELGERLLEYSSVWQSKRDEIRQLYHTSTARIGALIKFYIRYHYAPSWQHIASKLQGMGLQDLADMVTTKYVRGRQLQVYHRHSELHQSLIQCLSCCPSCTTLVVPHYYYCK